MSRSDRPPGAEALDDDEAYDDEVCDEEAYEEQDAVQGEGDGPAPAASLTSIRLTRRRSRAKAQSSFPSPRPEAGTEKPNRDQDAASAAPPAAPPELPAPAGSQRPSSIVDYWSRLRGERPYPAPAELDAGLIAASWPNAMLLRRLDGETGLRAAALYKPEAEPANPANHSDHTLDLSPMVVEWILSLGERALRGAQPIAEKESFERPRGSICYAGCALPLSEDGAEVDHVLCYLRILN